MSGDEGPSKRQKLFDYEPHNYMTTAEPSTAVAAWPAIFMLNIDCFQELFEYLTLEDLISFGKTCTRLQQVAGHYFKQNYSKLKVLAERYVIHHDNCLLALSCPKKSNLLLYGFEQFIKSLEITSKRSKNMLPPFYYLMSHMDKFIAINQIQLCNPNIDIKDVMEKIGKQLETLKISTSGDCDLYENCLKFCKNLKKLSITFTRPTNGWLNQIYPTLEYIQYIQKGYILEFDEPNTFLEINKTIKHFSTDGTCLWQHRHLFTNSSAKLEILEVHLDSLSIKREPTIHLLCELINELHDIGFYKRLHLNIGHMNRETNIFTATLSGLEKMTISKENRWMTDAIATFPFTLKELCIWRSVCDPRYLNIRIKELINLEYVHLKIINYTPEAFALPFISQLSKLSKLIIEQHEKKCVRNESINLATLNMKRKKLANARKVIFYVDDDIFVKTKWAAVNGSTNLSHIIIKRITTHKC